MCGLTCHKIIILHRRPESESWTSGLEVSFPQPGGLEASFLQPTLHAKNASILCGGLRMLFEQRATATLFSRPSAFVSGFISTI